MAKENAVVDYKICDLEKCGAQDGKCPAVKVCKHKVLIQEELGEPPYQFGLCRGCSTCIAACPLKAIRLQ
jgi:translation initiation factor RLI1